MDCSHVGRKRDWLGSPMLSSRMERITIDLEAANRELVFKWAWYCQPVNINLMFVVDLVYSSFF